MAHKLPFDSPKEHSIRETFQAPPGNKKLDDSTTEAIREFFAQVYANNAEYIKFLSGAQLDLVLEARDTLGRTPLMIAAQEGCREAMDELVIHNASMTAEDNENRTAYDYMENFGDARREQEVRMSVREAVLHSTIDKAIRSGNHTAHPVVTTLHSKKAKKPGG